MTLRLQDRLALFNTKGEGIPSAFELIAFKGEEAVVIESMGQADNTFEHQVGIQYQNRPIGRLLISGVSAMAAKLYGDHWSPLLRGCELDHQALQYNLKVLDWVNNARKIAPEISQWTGIYYKTSFLNGEESTDLVLGPYIGAATEHDRISISRGFCGMALREERTVNVADVNADDTHIACSLSTRSELVIPLKNSAGEMIAELDIDSDRLAAFTPEIQAKLETYALSFAAI